MEETLKTYKAFDKDFKCLGFQYEVGKEDEVWRIEMGKQGFHAYENPFDVLDYYPLTTSRFAEVEQSGEILRAEKNSTKICSSKIKIVKELSLADFIKAGVEWIKAKVNKSDNADHAYIGSGRGWERIGSCGSFANIGSSGDYDHISSSGNEAYIGSCGEGAKIGSCGDYGHIGSCGAEAKIASSGDCVSLGSCGDYARINSTGDNAIIMCAGHNSEVRANFGSWITLAEWETINDENGIKRLPKCVKTFYVDGETVKADTWYKLAEGELQEVRN